MIVSYGQNHAEQWHDVSAGRNYRGAEAPLNNKSRTRQKAASPGQGLAVLFLLGSGWSGLGIYRIV